MPGILLNKATYFVGDEIDIQIDFSDAPGLLENVSNIQIDIFRVDIERNNFVFGFGATAPTENIIAIISQKLPATFQTGLYVVSGIRLIYGEDGQEIRNIRVDDPRNRFFWLSDDEILDEADLHKKVSELENERNRYVNAEIRTNAATGRAHCEQFKVVIFGVGCLLHAPQLMEGYVLHPLGQGYSYDHMLEAVNTFMHGAYGIALEKVDSIASSFSSSTPLFAVEFNNIQAVDHLDAGAHCAHFAENIFTILAYDRGQRPRSFASVMINLQSEKIWQGFHFPGYKGNLVSDFNPASTANTLQRLLPKIESSPWVDLILRIYADAKTENNRDYACLKFWQILEMVAKKRVLDNSIEIAKPDGAPIMDANGKIISTRYALGKVYKYLFDREGGSTVFHIGENDKVIFEASEDARNNPNFDQNTKVVSLWETLSALYEIRNATAHSGKFDIDNTSGGTERERKAAELLELSHGTFIHHVESILMMTVSSEVNNA
ncbi:hypothetical protein [Methylobacter svalbardensis]|uniref:hypothetical protein n=1 Tax=Methylobacter svalbardensis TaxID=3080016 RepID=UPI0030EEFEB3